MAGVVVGPETITSEADDTVRMFSLESGELLWSESVDPDYDSSFVMGNSAFFQLEDGDIRLANEVEAAQATVAVLLIERADYSLSALIDVTASLGLR